MKVTIKLKKDTSGVKNDKPWRMLSLLCSVDTIDEANEIAMHGVESGLPQDQIEKLIKKNDYNGKISYQFNINPSSFTFEHVERYGILDIDAKNLVISWDGRFANAKIKVISGVEQISGYKHSDDFVTGWASPAPEIKPQQPLGDGNHAEPNPIETFVVDAKSLNPNPTDLPF